jgi:hypothetical protein
MIHCVLMNLESCHIMEDKLALSNLFGFTH